MTLKETIEEVAKFHDAFKIGNNFEPTVDLTKDEILLRYKLMREENEEYLEAAENGDMVEVADALGDMLYILCGTILKHGMQDKIAEVFQEIQRSNMSKLDENGEPIYREDGKVMKSKLYFKPDSEKFAHQLSVNRFVAHGESVKGANEGAAYTEPACQATVKFKESGTVFATSYCNIHGLWESSARIEIK